MRLKSIGWDSQSKFQHVQVIETSEFGKTLVLDSKTQSAKFDEKVYHESLCHPALLCHPNPKKVFIGGGGEMATPREVLRHHSVEEVVMVDIDQMVMDVCLDQLPEWSDGCHNDKRLKLICDDAFTYLMNDPNTYDVVIMDIADPIEAGPGIKMYFQEFYQALLSKKKLHSNGIFVTQSGPGSILNVKECNSTIHNTLLSQFDHVIPFASNIPSFGSPWGFNVAFNDAAITENSLLQQVKTKAEAERTLAGDTEAMVSLPTVTVNKLISSRIKGGVDGLHFYDGVSHKGMFGLPKPMRKAFESETRIMTEATPVFMH
eukprot:g475.t1